ncbi:MAG: prepilin-type N-terminal cleavage/methylation domain-containing protein [Veillonellaceae bacterium]|nr:prepilin-type N-terminal cleavage/methylation domain-containing protein [Veillonellaceae bacterium]
MNKMNPTIHTKLQGFTIVELLIVIVVIAILAAIAIAAYSGITNRAYDTAVRSDFANFIKKYETIRVLDGANQYSDPTAAMGFSFSKDAYITGRNNMYLCINPERNQYAIGAQSKSGKSFRYDTITGKTEEVASVDQAATCIAAGTTSPAASYANSAYKNYAPIGWASWAN